MSEGQKKRKYGDRSGSARSTGGGSGKRRTTLSASAAAGRSARGSATAGSAAGRGLDPVRHEPIAPGAYRQEDLRAEPEKKSSAGILVGVLTGVAVLLFVYLHALVLPSLGGHFGVVLPDLRATGFGREEIARTATGLGSEGLADYRYVHRSSGLLQPIVLALAWAALVAAARLPRGLRLAAWALPMLYAVVALGGNAVLNTALADPAAGPAGWAAALVVARWVLVLALLVEAVWLFVRLVRSKVDAFSRGELPEQQEARQQAERRRAGR